MHTGSKKHDTSTDANNVLADVKYLLEAFKIPKERFGKKKNDIIGVDTLKIFNCR